VARQQDGDTLKLKRERAGRYVTADGRFAVEGDAAGAWYLIDSERQNELGLPLVQGPFPTIDVARQAVAEAARAEGDKLPPPGPHPKPRAPKVAPAPLAPRPLVRPTPGIPDSGSLPAARTHVEAPGSRPRLRALETPSESDPAQRPPVRSGSRPTQETQRARPAPSKDASLEEPAWLARLQPEQRVEARRLLSLLERAGINDPAPVRREIEAGLPEVARALLAHRVQRDAIEPWAGDPNVIDELTAGTATTKEARDPRIRAAKAAMRRLLTKGNPEDLALFAWLVAYVTSIRIFEALEHEGRDPGQGLRGWRLVELGAGRAPTGRALAIDEPDLLGG
jgi:hypothetical protein